MLSPATIRFMLENFKFQMERAARKGDNTTFERMKKQIAELQEMELNKYK
jgi:uncharacterized membrane protein (DUF106 family)